MADSNKDVFRSFETVDDGNHLSINITLPTYVRVTTFKYNPLLYVYEV